MFAGPATLRNCPPARGIGMLARAALRMLARPSLRMLSRASLMAALAAMLTAHAAHAQRLIVVRSDDSLANSRAVAGMRNHAEWTIDSRRIGASDGALGADLSQATASTAIVALGTHAAQYVAQLQVAAPVVDCMVQGDQRFTSSAQVVPLAIPVAAQIRWMKQLLPAVRKVAILFDPAQNQLMVAEMTRQLSAAGYQVMAKQVASPAALPPALAKLGDADALLALPDSTVYSPELAKGLLLFTYRTNTPMIALSDAWVRAGALYSLEWDYAELGSYCAALAVHLISAPKNAVAPAPALPQPQVSVNRRAALQLRLKWDATSLAGVTHVHD